MQKSDIDPFQKHTIATHVKNTKHQKRSGNKPMQPVLTCQKAMVIFHVENDQIQLYYDFTWAIRFFLKTANWSKNNVVLTTIAGLKIETA
jgi:hypothetical protein